MKLMLSALVNFVFLGLIAQASFAGLLETAKNMATNELRGYTYGSSGSNRIDCTQFITLALQKHGLVLNKGVRNAINITELSADDLQQAVETNDDRVRGVQYASSVLTNVAIDVALSDVQPGDLVQLWNKTDTLWRGHAGIVSKTWVDAQGVRRMKLWGAHQSPSPNGLIGESQD